MSVPDDNLVFVGSDSIMPIFLGSVVQLAECLPCKERIWVQVPIGPFNYNMDSLELMVAYKFVALVERVQIPLDLFECLIVWLWPNWFLVFAN